VLVEKGLYLRVGLLGFSVLSLPLLCPAVWTSWPHFVGF